ncbi:hypothetical protein [Symbiopectobacterium sp. RP]|uniref:hypothetical protein n=1 Tax=Symbiopectobacterium sp. RP TaxID=3248553 RepID=UPI003D2B8E0F
MACVLVWRLQRAEGDDNAAARQLICRLSGRQQKRGRKESAPALLAGLSILLNIAKRLKNDYSQCPDMWQKNTANCYQNNVAWL